MDQGIVASSIPIIHGAAVRARRAVSRLGWLAVCLTLIGSVAGAQGKGLHVELNKLEAIGNGCRAYLVFGNATDDAFSVFKIDLVLFDRNGVISKRLAVDVAPLRPRKTTVKLFDIQGIACADTGRILINDVIECLDGEIERRNCVALVTPSSRADTELVK